MADIALGLKLTERGQERHHFFSFMAVLESQSVGNIVEFDIEVVELLYMHQFLHFIISITITVPITVGNKMLRRGAL